MCSCQSISTGIALAAAGALTIGTADGEAQTFDTDRQSALEIRAGGAFPGSDLDDFFDPGFSAGIGYAFPLSERVRFAFQGDVGFLSDVGVDDEIGEGEVRQFFEGDLRLWHYGGDLQFDLTDPTEAPVAVMIHGGAGATTVDPERLGTIEGTDDPILTDADRRTRFTVNGGLSLGFSFSENVDLVADGKAYAIFLQDEDYETDVTDDDLIGETWWSFPVQLMLRFRMP